MPWAPSFRTEGHIDAKFLLEHKPDARIAVLVQHSLVGEDYLRGIEEGLGERAKAMIVKVLTYQATDTTIDSQIVSLRASGADVFFNISVPKFAAQAIRMIYEINWKPLHMLAGMSTPRVVLEMAGLEKCIGIVSVAFLKFPDDPEWDNDPAVREWRAWMDKYYPEGDKGDAYNVYAYLAAQTLVRVLKQSGDDLSRENIMHQAANLHDLELPLLLPGMRINTSPTDYRLVKQMRPMRFNGRNWELFGDLITG
jgi:branched-chain amino acid transport system substrate-binding protein